MERIMSKKKAPSKLPDSDGLFDESVCVPGDETKCLKYFETRLHLGTFDDILNNLEMCYTPSIREFRKRGSNDPYEVEANAPATVRDRSTALKLIRSLRTDLSEQLVDEALLAAFNHGRVVERGVHRIFEPLAATGKKLQEGGRAGNKRAFGSREERRERHEIVKGAIDEVLRKEPNIKLLSLDKRISADMAQQGIKISSRTVRRVRQGLVDEDE
jgi:hypothetical protein